MDIPSASATASTISKPTWKLAHYTQGLKKIEESDNTL